VPPRTVRPLGFSTGPPSLAPITRFLCIAIVVISLLSVLTQRQLGFGAADLNFQVGSVLGGQLWRLATYPFIESQVWGLILSVIFLWFFGSWFENRWGERDFLKFFALTSVGGALLAIPLSFVLNMLLGIIGVRDIGMAEGPGAALDGMLVALALTAPDSNIMFGFVLPIRARTAVLLFLGLQVVIAIMDGGAALSIHVGGMVMGYLLVTGHWRPRRLVELASTVRRRRRGLRLVPPRDRTLH